MPRAYRGRWYTPRSARDGIAPTTNVLSLSHHGPSLLQSRPQPPDPRPLSRPGVRLPAPEGRRALRAADPRDQPGGALLAHDPAETEGVPRGVPRLRPRGGRPVRCAR